jgi:hypothetical protein
MSSYALSVFMFLKKKYLVVDKLHITEIIVENYAFKSVGSSSSNVDGKYEM